MKTSLILLAGGSGSRMKSPVPKQFHLLKNKPIVHYSLELFLDLGLFEEIIVVAHPHYQTLFAPFVSVKFAIPGKRRQDSVYSGLQHVNKEHTHVCIHDAARPFITREQVTAVLRAGQEHGAATLAVPVKYTVKQGYDHFVHKTLNRNTLFEIQTPQVLKKELLDTGFALVQEKNLEITDDVSLAELLGHPVKLVEGSSFNMKITTQEDMSLAPYYYAELFGKKI